MASLQACPEMHPHFNAQLAKNELSKVAPIFSEQIAIKTDGELLALCGWRTNRSHCFFAFPDLTEPTIALECVSCFRRFE